ncbi:tetratricopeptide repeat protein [Reichenbachiella versicolor]|uniref:tetratricopeptide repeat protein n=1 Tax=Reichenbachiella versicolor TaxID=1821036 RepID=UPI000D6E2005|nr:hypothetical protein [Reichenbachiella versicolor]
MSKISFWSEWGRLSQLAFKVLSVFTLLLIATVLVTELGGLSYFYSWEMTGYLEEVLLPVFSDHSDYIESSVQFGVNLLFQKAGATFQLLPKWGAYAFFAVFILCLSGILAIVSHLSRFWFIASMGFLVLALASAGVAKIGVLGLTGQLAVGTLTIPLIALCYFFNTIRNDIGVGLRFFLILDLFVVLIMLIALTSSVQYPILTLAYNVYWPALALSVVFIFMVGHEVIHAILVLTTQGSKEDESGNTLHFIVFSVIYLINVVLLYMRNVSYIDWDIYYLNDFLLLSVSSILGLWGLKNREQLYQGVLPFRPHLVYLFFALAILTFSTILFVSIAGNDSTIEVFEDAIVFGHIGFGGSFLVYLIANFISLLMKNLPVHKIAFREDNFPYATSRLVGFIVVLAFFFASSYAALYQSVSGYFNGIADMYLMTEQKTKAVEYYHRASTYGNILYQSNNNHKSNLMLGILEPEGKKAIAHFVSSTKKRPTPYAFANLGSVYESENMFFDAMFTYQKALKLFPNNWAINNNLALLFNRTNVLDSTVYYLTKIKETDWKQNLVESNLLAVRAKHGGKVDNIETNFERVSMISNALAYDVINQNEVREPQIMVHEGTRLNLFTFSYLNNLGLVCLQNGDESYLLTIDKYLLDPNNGDYYKTLSLLKGANLYVNGRMTEAFTLMNQLRGTNNEMEAKAIMIMGKWAMELGQPFLANKYFELSREAGYPWATADLAQSYGMTNNSSVAQYILFNEYSNLDTTRYSVEIEQLKNLEQALDSGLVVWKGHQYDFEREATKLQAIISDEGGKEAYIALGLNNPFYEEGVIATAEFLNKNGENEEAYNVLQNAITINEYSEALIREYIDQCFKMGLTSYAESTILRLYDILPINEYNLYEQEFEVKKSESIAKSEEW